jgi:uncharacterized coiled-coil protein SlyX
MTDQRTNMELTPVDVLARQKDAIDELAMTCALQQRQLDELRRRVQALEGVPWPEHGPPSGE